MLAQLQGGGTPAAFAPPASPFPDVVQPQAVDEAAMAAAAREAAGARMMRANQRRIDPFAFPDQNSAGVQLAMGQGPAGTGVPVEGSPQFAPMSMAGVPQSVQLASSMAKPPQPAGPPPMQPQAPIAGLNAPIGGAPAAAAGGAPVKSPGMQARDADERATDFSDVRRERPPMSMAGAEPSIMDNLRGFGDKLREISPNVIALGAGLAGEGWDKSAQVSLLQQKQREVEKSANITGKALLARGAPPDDVAAALKSPEVLKAMIVKYFETKPAQVVNGRLVRERPDGSVETLADYSKADENTKPPKVENFKLSDGSEVQRQWNVEKKRWDMIPGFEAPVPGQRDRRMSVADITKLAKEGGQLEHVRGFETSFKPDFAGWKSDAAGNLANQAGRNLPESIVGKTRAEAASWWQDYDRYKNVVRHGLYGASLTANEQKAFTSADITPGMTPDQVKRNLATQKKVIEGSIRREGRALIGSTYDKSAISRAYGVPESFFDDDAPSKSAPAPVASGKVKIGNIELPWSVN